jgi:EAL domain-containing protein (putative c-di-GMP-specific phosphodiesterase class I)
MHTRAVTRLAIETDLRRAVDNHQFELHYQPIKWLDGDQIVGVEALVRWRRPDGTLVPPGDFIPVAEETGLIHPIGHWVLHEACRQLARWRSELPQAAGLSMSVNVSACQLQDASLISDVESALRESGLDPGSLILELTESAVVENFDGTSGTLQQLRWMAVQLAMDDFGTGYSSLSNLSRLPLDILKIDQSFVARLDQEAEGRAIVYAIVSLARALGVRVTGEGIETASQLVDAGRARVPPRSGLPPRRAGPRGELAAVLRTVADGELTVAAAGPAAVVRQPPAQADRPLAIARPSGPTPPLGASSGRATTTPLTVAAMTAAMDRKVRMVWKSSQRDWIDRQSPGRVATVQVWILLSIGTSTPA